ncbi:hypothetical protein EE896_19575 (plasmid) [Pantoea eucalypti]|uniref:Uncharacterized protein n=1 Tax=Pantoea eucalypti TaxID=470933 RepID=A0ABY2ZQ50_9GAMM|nr:hypothetical protein [Pantoea eucalypti]QGF29039.1 hypothetical protein EE896_19575 [Pantoea eucalypti]TPV42743.1 hypothetical protein FJW02_02690 [Pantoea eucalypti]
MANNNVLFIKISEEPLMEAILKKMKGVIEMNELCIKETTQIVGHAKIIKRNIVTHSDRGLLEIMPNGSFREMNDYIYKRGESDNILMPKSPEGNGEVRDMPLDEAWTLTQKEILIGNLKPGSTPVPPTTRIRGPRL